MKATESTIALRKLNASSEIRAVTFEVGSYNTRLFDSGVSN